MADTSDAPGATITVVGEGKDSHVKRSDLAAEGKIPDHAHKVATSYVVLSGSGRATGATARDVSAGDVVVVEAGEKHGWENSGKDTFSIVGFFPESA